VTFGDERFHRVRHKLGTGGCQGQMSVMAMLRQSPVVPVSVLEPAAVNIGISNGAKTEVLSGLKESDQVVLQ